MTKTLRLHIHNPLPRPGTLRLERERLELALAGRGLADRFSISEAAGGDELADIAADAEILFLVNKAPLDKARQKAKGLRWVQTAYAGVEHVLPSLPADLQLVNASGVHSEKGAEFVLAAVLMLNYRMPQFIEDKASKAWTPAFAPTLRTRRVLMLGLGAIGGAAATSLKRQGCEVIGVTRSGKATVEVDTVADPSALDELLPNADFLVSSLPDTELTRGMIDRRRIDMLPEGAGIVVVGRAPVLDYDAIMDRLDAGTLGGAVLDVFPEEPIPKSDRIWTTPRLLITPHCSIDDHTVYMDRCIEIFVDNLERDLTGRKLRNLVDPAVGY